MPQNHPIFNPFCCTTTINSHEMKLSISKISKINLFYRFKLIIPIWRVIPLRSTSNRSVMRYQNKYNNKRSIFWGLLKSQEMRGRVPVNRRGKNPPPAVAPIQQTRYAKYECWNWKKFTKLIIFIFVSAVMKEVLWEIRISTFQLASLGWPPKFCHWCQLMEL